MAARAPLAPVVDEQPAGTPACAAGRRASCVSPGEIEASGVQVRNLTRGTVLAVHLEVARGFLARGWGLLGRSGLPDGHGLLLAPCDSIHTFWMRFPIDVVLLDRGTGTARCLAVARALRPWRLGPLLAGVRAVLELPAGAAGETAVGDEVAWGVGPPPGGAQRG